VVAPVNPPPITDTFLRFNDIMTLPFELFCWSKPKCRRGYSMNSPHLHQNFTPCS
jgi:hypothetical protein